LLRKNITKILKIGEIKISNRKRKRNHKCNFKRGKERGGRNNVEP
jgi:hypothetical protein